MSSQRGGCVGGLLLSVFKMQLTCLSEGSVAFLGKRLGFAGLRKLLEQADKGIQLCSLEHHWTGESINPFSTVYRVCKYQAVYWFGWGFLSFIKIIQ